MENSAEGEVGRGEELSDGLYRIKFPVPEEMLSLQVHLLRGLSGLRIFGKLWAESIAKILGR